MKLNLFRKLKATILLIVFSMNTVIGFACSIGIDMDFNSKYHHDDVEEKIKPSIPLDGKERQHIDGECNLHHDDDEGELTGTSVHVNSKQHQQLDEESKYDHYDEETIETSVPINAKEHQHNDEESKPHHDDDATTSLVEDTDKEHPPLLEEAKHHHDSTGKAEKGGCCHDGVVQFQNLEENLVQNNTLVIYVHVFATILSNFWSTNIFNFSKALPQHHKARFFHPPSPDILIVIQRFQI